MLSFIYIEEDNISFWQRKKGKWIKTDPDKLSTKYVWLITNLSDEACQADSIPALLWHDRNKLLKRKIDAAYPDTIYKSYVWLGPPIYGAGNVALFALGANDRITPVLDIIKSHHLIVEGLSTSTALLWAYAKKKYKDDVYILLYRSGEHIRLIAINRRLPILTRYLRLSAAEDAKLQHEIEVTWQYLINRKIASVSTRPVVYLLNSSSFEENELLFSIRPRINLAPLELKLSYYINRLDTGLLFLTLAVFLWSTVYLSFWIKSWNERKLEVSQVASRISEVRRSISSLKENIRSGEYTYDLLVEIGRVVENILQPAPDPVDDFNRLSGKLEFLRNYALVSSISWSLAGSKVCHEQADLHQLPVSSSQDDPLANLDGRQSDNLPHPTKFQRQIDIVLIPKSGLSIKSLMDFYDHAHTQLSTVVNSQLIIDETQGRKGLALSSERGLTDHLQPLRFCLKMTD